MWEKKEINKKKSNKKKQTIQLKRVAWLIAILNEQIYKRNDKETRKAKMTIKKKREKFKEKHHRDKNHETG